MVTSKPRRQRLIDIHAVADILGVDAWRAERIAKIAPGFPRYKQESPYRWDEAEIIAFAESRIRTPRAKPPLDPRITRLINALRDIGGPIDVHTVHLDMGGLHQVTVKLQDQPNSQLANGRMRAPMAELLIALGDALPLLHQFLESHWFAEAYDDVRASNEQLCYTMERILAELRRIGIFRT